MKSKLSKLWNKICSIGINTWLLWLILMMMFGNYSQKYYVGTWGILWRMEIIAPYVYYVANIMAIILIILIIISSVARVRGKKDD